MPTVRIPISLSWGGGVSGAPGANVWHGRILTGSEQADLDEIVGAVENFYTACADLYTADLTISFLGEASGVGDDAGSLYTSDPWTVTGTDGLDHLAPVLQMLVNWRTPTGGRQGRGRTYIGPLSTGVHQDNGTPQEAARSLLQDAADALIEESDSFANGALGVYSRVGDTFRDFVSAAVPNEFAILTSRRD
jgi:hypothetical protein